MDYLSLSVGYEKDIFPVLCMTLNSHANHGEAVYIIRNLLRYIIKPQGKCTLTRDEMQGRLADLDDMYRTSRGDDMPSLRLG